MVGQGVMHRFQDLKTQSKLLVSFGVVSVIIMFTAKSVTPTISMIADSASPLHPPPVAWTAQPEIDPFALLRVRLLEAGIFLLHPGRAAQHQVGCVHQHHDCC